MDLTRIAIVIWLILPIPVFLIVEWRHRRFEDRLPHRGTAKIVAAEHWKKYSMESAQPMTTVVYQYSVLGNAYRATQQLVGTYEVGQELKIRFSTERLGQSAVDEFPTPWGWILVGGLILAGDLGAAFFCLAMGLLISFVGVRMAFFPPAALGQRRIVPGILVTLLLGLPFVAAGILYLSVDSFWNQNILWQLWFHRPVPGLSG